MMEDRERLDSELNEPLVSFNGRNAGVSQSEEISGERSVDISWIKRFVRLEVKVLYMGGSVALCLLAWFGGVNKVFAAWIRNCITPDNAQVNFSCSTARIEFLSFPLLSATTLVVLALLFGNAVAGLKATKHSFKPRFTQPLSEKVSFSTASALEALFSVLAGTSGCVIALIKRKCASQQDLSVKDVFIFIFGVIVIVFVTKIRERWSSLVFLVNVYMNAWLVTLLILGKIGIPCQEYCNYWVFGLDVVYLLPIFLVTRILVELFLRNDESILSMGSIMFLANAYLTIFCLSAIAIWENGRSANIFWLVPFSLLASTCCAFIDLSTFAAQLFYKRFQRSISIEANGNAHSWQENATLLEFCTFWWVTPSLRMAKAAGQLCSNDLPGLPTDDQPQILYNRFLDKLSVSHLGLRNRWRRLVWWTGVSIQSATFLSSFLHGWLFLFAMLMDPVIFKVLIGLVEHKNSTEESQSLKLVCVLAASMFVRVTCMEICYFESTRVSNNMRTVLTTAIFRKSLLINDSRSSHSTGTLVNLMATDADKLGNASAIVWTIACWIWAVLTLPVVLWGMYQTVGNASFAGVFSLVLGSFLCRWVAAFEISVVKALQECRDNRSQLVKELVQSISVIKLNAWEDQWQERVGASRVAEMTQLRRLRFLGALTMLVSALMQVAVPVSIFSWLVLVDKKRLDATTAFTSLAWINQMKWSLGTLPSALSLWTLLSPTLKRLSHFLLDSDTDWVEVNCESARAESTRILKEDISIEIGEAAILGYSSGSLDSDIIVPVDDNRNDGTVEVLRDVELKIYCGDFTAIIGSVGSGKSTMLAVMAQALRPLSGFCAVNGSRAYVGQNPFLFNGTIQDNILFGKEYEKDLYDHCLKLASLDDDLKLLPLGDKSSAGGNGVQLSGGQRARVALARALYSEADCYFLDDILSAVDAATGLFIWRHTLTDFLKHKTVVLVTHQLQLLGSPDVNSVILLDEHRVVAHSSWALIREQRQLKPLLSRCTFEAVKEQFQNEVSNEKPVLSSNLSNTILQSCKDTCEADKLLEIEKELRLVLNRNQGAPIDNSLINRICDTMFGRNISVDQKNDGVIRWRDVKVYLDAFGSRIAFGFLLLSTVVAVAAGVAGNVWLSSWVDSNTSTDAPDNGKLYVYSAIGVFGAFSDSLKAIVLTLCALAAARTIHAKMLKRLLRATMSFFDITPAGQILNRFLQDMSNIDNFVPDALLELAQMTLDMATQIILVIILAPWVLLCLPFLGSMYFWILSQARCAVRDTRRIEAVAHSPVYTHFSDVLTGRPCIRAFGKERWFEKRHDELVSEMARAKYANEAISKWVQALTTQNGCLLYLVVGISAVILAYNGVTSAGQLGLVLACASNLQRSAMGYMIGLSTIESRFISVERIADFLRIPVDAGAYTAEKQASRKLLPNAVSWPTSGCLEIVQVKMRYALYRPLSLRGVSFRVEGKSKVALCGRTGCGKSSLFKVIGRLYPVLSGRILIDGKDIFSISLNEFRKHVRFVTQEAMLFTGTLRDNLCGKQSRASDSAILEALESVRMRDFVEKLPGGMNYLVEEGGANFSVGERQLLCFVRGILCDEGPPKLLFFDEATASMDLGLDELIHDLILNMEMTVIMICHRLHHIRRFDKVLVMGPGGLLLEEGSPLRLLSDPSSHISGLFDSAGLERS